MQSVWLAGAERNNRRTAVRCRRKFNAFRSLQKTRAAARRSLAKPAEALQDRASGEMAEWLKAHAWKACVRETVPWVRIPLSPPQTLSPSFADVQVSQY